MNTSAPAVRVTRPTVRPGDPELASLEEAGLNAQFEAALAQAHSKDQ